MTGKTLSEIKAKIRDEYTGLKKIQISQIATFFVRLTHMKKGDIILIPYIELDGPTITVATVTKTYHYDSDYFKDDMAHQVGIEPKKVLDRNDLAKKFENFNNSLKSRLTLTKIDKKRHQDAVKYIENIALNALFALNYGHTKSPQAQYEKSIKKIKSRIDESSDELAIKAFIFSALSINEAYLTTFITNEILTDSVKNDEQLYEAINNNIIDRLYERRMRNKITKTYFKKGATICQEYSNLRNSLAHDINSVEIKENEISYPKNKRNKDDKENIDINEMFADLEKYAPIPKNEGPR